MDLYGTGAVNGALNDCSRNQFYILMPILYHTKKKTSFDTTNCDLSVSKFYQWLPVRSLFLKIYFISFFHGGNVHNWLLGR